jgi:hypothetical protein
MKSGKPQLGNVQILFCTLELEDGHSSALVPFGLTSRLFSKFPLQPKNVYVIEMGCGDDKWAQDIFSR